MNANNEPPNSDGYDETNETDTEGEEKKTPQSRLELVRTVLEVIVLLLRLIGGLSL